MMKFTIPELGAMFIGFFMPLSILNDNLFISVIAFFSSGIICAWGMLNWERFVFKQENKSKSQKRGFTEKQK